MKLTRAEIWGGLSLLLPFLYAIGYFFITLWLAQAGWPNPDSAHGMAGLLSAVLLGLTCLWKTGLSWKIYLPLSFVYLFCMSFLLVVCTVVLGGYFAALGQ